MAAKRREKIIVASTKKARDPLGAEPPLRRTEKRARQPALPGPQSSARPPSIIQKTEPEKGSPSAPTRAETTPAPEPTDDETEETLREATKDRFIKEVETLDFTVAREQLILDGRGRVDVALRLGTRSITCQIRGTTTPEHEVENVRKCLEVHSGHVATMCPNVKRLPMVEQAIRSALYKAELERDGIYLVGTFITKLYDWALEDTLKRQRGTGQAAQTEDRHLRKAIARRAATELKGDAQTARRGN